mmetsp:Transcript_648/g.1294  ORF Transcript_648/g.1294 Transcript_648/m.1294 type:complete len:441 (-) Transcript_648:42-1364(-)
MDCMGTPCSPSTSRGSTCHSNMPWPSWPIPPSPQVKTFPSHNAKLWYPPAWMSHAGEDNLTRRGVGWCPTGAGRCSSLSKTSGPWSQPQAKTDPSQARARVWASPQDTWSTGKGTGTLVTFNSSGTASTPHWCVSLQPNIHSRLSAETTAVVPRPTATLAALQGSACSVGVRTGPAPSSAACATPATSVPQTSSPPVAVTAALWAPAATCRMPCVSSSRGAPMTTPSPSGGCLPLASAPASACAAAPKPRRPSSESPQANTAPPSRAGACTSASGLQSLHPSLLCAATAAQHTAAGSTTRGSGHRATDQCRGTPLEVAPGTVTRDQSEVSHACEGRCSPPSPGQSTLGSWGPDACSFLPVVAWPEPETSAAGWGCSGTNTAHCSGLTVISGGSSGKQHSVHTLRIRREGGRCRLASAKSASVDLAKTWLRWAPAARQGRR